MKNEWFKDWFASEEYLQVYNHRNQEDAKRIIDIILSTTKLKKNSIILDSACGTGRHAIYLSSLGFTVFGFDLSKQFLQKAVKDNLLNKTDVKFFCSDIRYLCLNKKFDAILNLFTSFGYFETDEENFRFISNSYHMLLPGGFFVLDYLNKDFLSKNLVQKSSRKFGDFELLEERSIFNDRVVKRIVIRKDSNEKIFFESVKLYSKDYIISMFESFGYKKYKEYGDYLGNSFDSDSSPRMILIFLK